MLTLQLILQGLDHQAAETLSDLMVGNKQQEVVTELFAYMNLLGIQGMGLVDATERSPHIGHIIGTPFIHTFVAGTSFLGPLHGSRDSNSGP